MEEVVGDEGCEGVDDDENNGGRVASNAQVAERGSTLLRRVVEAENGAHDQEYSSRSNGFFEENGRRGDDARVSGRGVLLLGLVVLATMALCMSRVGGEDVLVHRGMDIVCCETASESAQTQPTSSLPFSRTYRPDAILVDCFYGPVHVIDRG